MAVADVYDALISKRVYKPPMPHEKAVQIIKEGKGSHFDPDMVDAFLELEAVFRNIALTFADYEEERQMLGGLSGAASSAGLERMCKILLVEDNPINQEIMFSQLSSSGHLVDVASNGKEALTKYRAGNYDLVLTDIEMPEMDGYALTAEIRRLEAGTGRLTPILAITASEFDLSAETAKERGFTGHMLKPLDLEVLERKLAALRPVWANWKRPQSLSPDRRSRPGADALRRCHAHQSSGPEEQRELPIRLLGVGMLPTILLGAIGAAIVFPHCRSGKRASSPPSSPRPTPAWERWW